MVIRRGQTGERMRRGVRDRWQGISLKSCEFKGEDDNDDEIDKTKG